MNGPEGSRSQEDLASIQKERTLSDAELLKGGAEYVVDNNKNAMRLEPTENQIKEIQETHRIEKGVEGLAQNELRNTLHQHSIGELILLSENLRKSYEAFPVNLETIRDGGVELLRMKGDPKKAYLSWSHYSGSTQGKIDLFGRIPGLDKEFVREVSAVCMCCGHIDEKKSPYIINEPKLPKNASDKRYKQWEEELKSWEKSDEFHRHLEWVRDEEAKFIQAIVDACRDQGIEKVIARKPYDKAEKGWDVYLPHSLSQKIETQEITSTGEINRPGLLISPSQVMYSFENRIKV